MLNNNWLQKIDRCKGIALSGIALITFASGCVTYVERPRASYPQTPLPGDVQVAPPPVTAQPVPVYVEPPPVQADVSIRISNEADFYEPLGPYGRWEVIQPYGRCWIPGRVAADWRPYCNGHWLWTERGWFWASDEPWGWATYHYGRWDWRPEFGWYWVPQTQWAPAWVSWHRSDRYVGWAPLHPSARFTAGGFVEVNERIIPRRGFVFIEERRFLEPVRPANVVVNNTTIINKTVNITNVKVVNKTVINEGPRTEEIERNSGQKVHIVQAQELRRRSEEPVVVRRSNPSPGRNPVQPAGNRQPEARAQKPVIASDPLTPAPATPPTVQEKQQQKSEPKTPTKPAVVRSERERPKVSGEVLPAKAQEKSAPNVVQTPHKPEPPKIVKESSDKKATAASQVEKKTQQAEKKAQLAENKDQRSSRFHPKHDQVAAEQRKPNASNKSKSQKKTEETEKN